MASSLRTRRILRELGPLCIGICQRHGGTLFRAHIIQTAAAMIYLRATRKRQMSSDCRTERWTDGRTDGRTNGRTNGKSNQSNTNERTIYKNKQQTKETGRQADRQTDEPGL